MARGDPELAPVRNAPGGRQCPWSGMALAARPVVLPNPGAAPAEKATGVTRRASFCVLDCSRKGDEVVPLKRLCWPILMILPLGATAADVYRSVDENGVVVYSDRPTGQTELIEIVTTVPGPRAAATTQPSDDESDESDESAATTPFGAEIPREATPEEIASDRARNCEYARQMVTTYSQSRRLFREGADGEREYLTGAEIDEARSRAESNVATWCD
jgi:hypothetical protein